MSRAVDLLRQEMARKIEERRRIENNIKEFHQIIGNIDTDIKELNGAILLLCGGPAKVVKKIEERRRIENSSSMMVCRTKVKGNSLTKIGEIEVWGERCSVYRETLIAVWDKICKYSRIEELHNTWFSSTALSGAASKGKGRATYLKFLIENKLLVTNGKDKRYCRYRRNVGISEEIENQLIQDLVGK
jgi:hypothetical protein